MKIVITAEDVNDWVYKGEGAANLILSYQGSLPLLLGKVLRVQKVSKDETLPPKAGAELSIHEQLIWANVAELIKSKSKDSLAQIYATCIMGPLLGTNHIDAGVRVSVSREFLEKVEVSTLNFRPAWRIDASKIDTLTHSALLSQTTLYFLVNFLFGVVSSLCGETEEETDRRDGRRRRVSSDNFIKLPPNLLWQKLCSYLCCDLLTILFVN